MSVTVHTTVEAQCFHAAAESSSGCVPSSSACAPVTSSAAANQHDGKQRRQHAGDDRDRDEGHPEVCLVVNLSPTVETNTATAG